MGTGTPKNQRRMRGFVLHEVVTLKRVRHSVQNVAADVDAETATAAPAATESSKFVSDVR